MPAFPNVYQDHLDLQRPDETVRVQASPADFGAASAEAVGRVGAGLGEVARAAYTIDQHLDESNVNEMDVAYTQFERQRKADFFSKQGRNALEDRQPFEADLNGKIAEISAGARSKEALEAFKKLTASRLNDTLTSADTYNRGQLNKYQNDTSTAVIDEASQNVVGGFHDPVLVAKNLGRMAQEVDAVAQRDGWSPETRDSFLKEQRANAFAKGFGVNISLDPYGVKKQLNAKDGYGAEITPEQKAMLLREADAEIDRRDAKWRGQVREQFNTQIDLLKLGVPVTSRMNLDTIKSALGADAALGYEIAFASSDKQSALATVPTSDLVNIMARPDLQATSEKDLRAVLLDRAEKDAAANVYKARVADPYGYLQDKGLVAQDSAVASIQSGDVKSLTALLSARRAAVEQNAPKLGLPPVPLTKVEADVLAQRLATLPAAAQGELFKGITGALGTGAAYHGLMSQIAPSAPTTAFAGALYTRGQRWVVSGAKTYNGAQAGALLLKGQQLIHPPEDEKGLPKFDLPSDSSLQQQWKGVVGTAYANQPGQEQAAYDAYRAAYAGLSAQVGDYSGKTINGERAKTAALIASGGTVNWAGQQVLLPWGVDAQGFRASIQKQWPQSQKQFPQYFAGRNPDDFNLIPVGDGVYNFASGGRLLIGPNGSPIRQVVHPDAVRPIVLAPKVEPRPLPNKDLPKGGLK